MNTNEAEKTLRQKLIELWTQICNTPGILRYQLTNNVQTKCLDGKYNFVCQLNTDRKTKRRPPIQIASLTPPFNNDEFNFTKVQAHEILFKTRFAEDSLITFLVNNSPLTEQHFLICPDLDKKQSQILTRPAVEYSLELLRTLDDRSYRVGYNSPGAFASVNHLHLHLMRIEEQLYPEVVPIIQLAPRLYKIDRTASPTDAFVFRAKRIDSVREVAEDVMTLIRFMLKNQIAHNLLFTMGSWSKDHSTSEAGEVRVFVFPRRQMYANKNVWDMNLAFCEFSGFVSVGDYPTYDALTEDKIVELMDKNSGDFLTSIAGEVAALYTDSSYYYVAQ